MGDSLRKWISMQTMIVGNYLMTLMVYSSLFALVKGKL